MSAGFQAILFIDNRNFCANIVIILEKVQIFHRLLRNFSLFVRFFVPLSCARRYFRSEKRRKMHFSLHFRSLIRTFAGVKQDSRRHIASWLLLAVFVPMLVFSSIHVHENHASALTGCVECVAHHCHGHIGQTDASFDACVLCQFLSITFVAVAAQAVVAVFNVLWIRYAPLPCALCSASRGHIVTRGPPVA